MVIGRKLLRIYGGSYGGEGMRKVFLVILVFLRKCEVRLLDIVG